MMFHYILADGVGRNPRPSVRSLVFDHVFDAFLREGPRVFRRYPDDASGDTFSLSKPLVLLGMQADEAGFGRIRAPLLPKSGFHHDYVAFAHKTQHI